MLKFWQRKKQKQDSSYALQKLSKEFRRALSNNKTDWQWDERFNAVLLHVDKQNKGKVVRVLEKHFSDYWNILFDEEMPAAVQQQVKRFDGLRPEQLLFSMNTADQNYLYCAWWPWQDGEKTSIRIGLFADVYDEQQQSEIDQLLKQTFIAVG